jgi:Flp pilus assembly protein TadD
MKFRLLLAAASLFGCACTHTIVTRSGVPVPAAPAAQPAPVSAFDRQIRNARDAGDGDYLLRTLRERVAAEPDSVGARLDLAKAYQERGYPDVALEICRLAAARFPESAEVELALVRLLHELKQDSEAVAGLQAFLKQHPQNGSEYYSWLGILWDELGELPTGELAHRQAIALAPTVDYLHNNLGYNLLRQHKPVEAATEFREALRLNPASQFARNNLGLALAGQNQAREAVASFQTGADAATAHSNLAAVLMEKGNYTEARKELALALSYNKQHPAALKNLELLSRLDGNAATLPGAPEGAGDRWQRWKSGFKKLFVGPLEDSQKKESAESATH